MSTTSFIKNLSYDPKTNPWQNQLGNVLKG
jgi:hypothetical protein